MDSPPFPMSSDDDEGSIASSSEDDVSSCPAEEECTDYVAAQLRENELMSFVLEVGLGLTDADIGEVADMIETSMSASADAFSDIKGKTDQYFMTKAAVYVNEHAEVRATKKKRTPDIDVSESKRVRLLAGAFIMSSAKRAELGLRERRPEM